MPNSLINKLSDEIGVSKAELENIWQNAITEAESKKIKNKYAYAVATLEHIYKSKSTNDSATTNRYIDDNGFLICPNSVITGSDVAQYYGNEIPNAQELKLQPDRIYSVYRPIEEIQDNDFNGKMLLSQHVGDLDATTINNHKNLIIGSVHDCMTIGDQLRGTITFQDVKAIDELEDGKKFLSAGYWYNPAPEKGVFNGMPYDIKMTNIRANHVAHVNNPRYKQAVVGDNNSVGDKNMSFVKKYPSLAKAYGRLGLDEDEVEKSLSSLDEEKLKEAEKKAEDDEKQAQEKAEALEKSKEDKKKVEDELEKIKGEVVHAKEKGMDSNTVQAMIDNAVSKALDGYKATNVALDSALSSYRALFGNVNAKAFDSADSVYNAILTAKGYERKDKSMDYKQGIVESLLNMNKPKTAPALDSNSFADISPELKKYLGV